MFQACRDEYLNHLAAKGYAQATVCNWRKYLNQFFQYLENRKIEDLKAVNSELIEDYRLRLKTEVRPRKGKALSQESCLNHMNAIDNFFKWLEATNRILMTPVMKTCEPRQFKADKLPNVLSVEAIIKILESCPFNTPAGLRDRAILELLYSTGIRRNELVNLNVADISLEGKELSIRKGKGGKGRVVPVGEYALKFIEAYLKMIRPWLVKSPEETALFLNSRDGTRLKIYSIGSIVQKVVEKSGLNVKAGPHTFRHSMATHLFRNGADLRHIQAILGHTSIESTEIYTHLTVEDLKQAVKKAHPHGGQKKPR